MGLTSKSIEAGQEKNKWRLLIVYAFQQAIMVKEEDHSLGHGYGILVIEGSF